MATEFFEPITHAENRNTPIFFIDVSGSTTDRLYTNEKNKSIKIMDYEFKLIREEAIKYHYTVAHIVCWSSEAMLFENVDPLDRKKLKIIKKNISPIIGGTHLMSGFNLLTDSMIDHNERTDIIILTDGEIDDSKEEIDEKIREIANKNVSIRIIAVEKGSKDYVNQNCSVGNQLYRYIRECNMTRVVNKFSIYNSLRREFVNLSNPIVPETHIPFEEQMFKRTDFKQFIVFCDSLLKEKLQICNAVPDIDKQSFKHSIMKFTHSLSLSIYHYIKSKTYNEQLGIIGIFCNMYQRFPPDLEIYIDARKMLLSEVNNHLAGKSTTFTESKKAKHLDIENTNIELMSNVLGSILGNQFNDQDEIYNNSHSFMIRDWTNGKNIIIRNSGPLHDLRLEKMIFRKSSFKINNLIVPSMIVQHNDGDVMKIKSSVQWIRILYARILNVSPSNPYIWYYVAMDCLIAMMSCIKQSRETDEQQFVSDYKRIINLFLDEEVFGTGKKLINMIEFNEKINIDYRIIKGGQLYSGLKLTPLSLFYLIVKEFVIARFTNNDKKISFHENIKKMCFKQISYDLGICANANETEILENPENVETENTEFNKFNWDDLRLGLIDLIKTKSLIEVIDCSDTNIMLIGSHQIQDTDIICPGRIIFNSKSDPCNICDACESLINYNLIPATNKEDMDQISNLIESLSHPSGLYKNHFIDGRLHKKFGTLTGIDDNDKLISPDVFCEHVNDESVEFDNMIIVDPISGSKMRVRTQEEFLHGVKSKFPFLIDLDMNNVVLAGGFVRSILLKQEMKDFDFFFHGLETSDQYIQRFNKLVLDLVNNVRAHYAKCNINIKFGFFFKPTFNVFEMICFEDPGNHINDEFVLDNFHKYKFRSMKKYSGPVKQTNNDSNKQNNDDNSKNQKHDDDSDDSDDLDDADDSSDAEEWKPKQEKNDKYYFEDNDEHGIRMRHRFQFILCKFDSKFSVTKSFDMFPSKVVFDGQRVSFTEKSLIAYKYMINEIMLDGGSDLFKHRVSKYFKYGFSIVFPPNDRNWTAKNYENDYNTQDCYYKGTNENRGPLSFKVRKIDGNVIIVSHNSNIEKMLERNETLENDAKAQGHALYISSLFCSFVAILRFVDINRIDYLFPQFKNILPNQQDNQICLEDLSINNDTMRFKNNSVKMSFKEKFTTLYTNRDWYPIFYKSLLLTNY